MKGAYYNEIDGFAAAWLRNLIVAGHIAPGEVDERSIVNVKADDLRGYTQCHFFAGIGGWSLALRMAGWDDRRPVFSGSCPCQPFSAAGKGLGTADERHLWPEFHRLIAECRPPIVFGEQVASAAGREWLAGVRADLEGLAYAVGAADLCAASAGAPHIRQRLWWVADRSGAGRRPVQQATVSGGRIEALSAREAESGRRGGTGRLAESSRGSAACGCSESGMGDAERAGLEGHAGDGDDESGWPLASGSIAETGRLDPWSEYVWIPCADGKARRIGFNTLALVDGLPGFLGAMRADRYAEAVKEVSRYGQAVAERPGEILRAVRSAILSGPASDWPMGKPPGVRQEEILLPYLRELETRCEAANENAQGSEASRAGVRGMRNDESASCSSRQWGSRRLERAEHSDALHLLSRLLAQHAEAAWITHSRQNAAPISPLSIGEPGRVGRLRAYGNAIVPAVAAEFIAAVMRCMP